MPSSRKPPNPRRQLYLKLSGMIESQLREAFARKNHDGELSQSSIAKALGVNRSAVHNRLTGKTNMTIETMADMIWALGQDVQFKIYDPADFSPQSNFYVASPVSDVEVDDFVIGQPDIRPQFEIAE